MRRTAIALVCALLMAAAWPSAARAAVLQQSWPAGHEAFGVTVDPRDGRLYVATSDHNNWNLPTPMYIVDPATGASSFTLPAPQVMSALDTSLDRLFVTMTSGLGFVDVPTRTLTTTVPTGAGAGLALDPATHHVYVATISGLSLVDGTNGAVLARRQAAGTSDAWWDVVQDAGRHRLYVANGNYGGSPSLVVLDDRDLSLIADLPLPAQPRLALAVDPARGTVYVGGFGSGTDTAGSVYAIDETTLQITRHVFVGDGGAGTFSMTLTPDGNTLYVSTTTMSAGAVVAVDTAGMAVAWRLPLSFQPGQSALHPDGHLYVSDFSGARLVAIRVTNSAPAIDALMLSPTSPRTNDLLQASVTAHDADNDPLTYSYEWLRNGTTIAGATGTSLDLSVPGNGDRGDTITVRVTVSDGQASTVATTSVVVADTPPTVALSLGSTTPGKRDVVTASAIASDDDGDALTFTWTWRLNGVVMQTSTGSAATSSFDLRSVETEFGDVLGATVVVSDGSATASANANATVTRPTH